MDRFAAEQLITHAAQTACIEAEAANLVEPATCPPTLHWCLPKQATLFPTNPMLHPGEGRAAQLTLLTHCTVVVQLGALPGGQIGCMAKGGHGKGHWDTGCSCSAGRLCCQQAGAVPSVAADLACWPACCAVRHCRGHVRHLEQVGWGAPGGAAAVL